jgi:hypothetical protein
VLNVNGAKTVAATFAPDTSLTVNGFTVFEEHRIGLLVASLSGLKVGDIVGTGGAFPAIDLSFISLRTTAPAQTLVITGLPPGLLYVANSDKTKGGTITGLVTGELGAVGVNLTRNTAAVRTGAVITTPASSSSFPFNINVLPFSYAGSYEVLIENDTTPVGKAKLTITTLTTPLVSGVKVPTAAFSATIETQGVVTTLGRGTTKTRTKSGSVQNPNTLISGSRLLFPVTFDAVTTPTASPSVSVTFSISPSSDLVEGTASSGGSSWTVRGFRLAKPGRAWTQRLTARLVSNLTGQDAPATVPGGIGFGYGTVASTSLVTLTGNCQSVRAKIAGRVRRVSPHGAPAATPPKLCDTTSTNRSNSPEPRPHPSRTRFRRPFNVRTKP